jgi:hypothetical protein
VTNVEVYVRLPETRARDVVPDVNARHVDLAFVAAALGRDDRTRFMSLLARAARAAIT